jgi:hypothetical protein
MAPTDKGYVPEEYKFDRIHRSCHLCKNEFKSGERFVSAVVLNAQELFERIDFCAGCWPWHPDQVFSYWEGVFPYREKPRLQDMEKVQKFFDRLLAKQEEGSRLDGVRFFTALVLMRKKRVKLTGTKTTESGAILRFEKGWDGESVDIPDPGITDEKLEEIRSQMEQLFEMELDAASPQAA